MDSLEQLKKDLESANFEQRKEDLESTLRVIPIDTSKWLQGDFYKKPHSKEFYYQWNETFDTNSYVRHAAAPSFVSAVARDPEVAKQALLQDMLALEKHFQVVAFLSLPSTIELKLAAREDEIPDTTMYVDLDLQGKPGVRACAAFCFFYAYKVTRQGLSTGGWVTTVEPVTDQMLKDAGLKHVAREGEIGKRID